MHYFYDVGKVQVGLLCTTRRNRTIILLLRRSVVEEEKARSRTSLLLRLEVVEEIDKSTGTV